MSGKKASKREKVSTASRDAGAHPATAFSERLAPLLDLAAEQFAEHGFEGASYNAMIERVGLSKGVAYHHFRDKADLFRAVVSRAIEPLPSAIGDWNDVETADAFWSQTEQMVERAMGAMAGNARTAALLRMAARSPGAMAEAFGAYEPAFTAPLIHALENGRRVGAVRDDLPVELLAACSIGLGSALDRWLAQHGADLGPRRMRTLATQSLSLFEQMLAPPQATRSRSRSKK
ncbi:MAG: helix-turn-helix transcriptional regulator [Polyangiaceae bacterium]|nr:helix-turn-helix transcriptional regulator [Polyangiaceae bacterium]